MKAFTYIKQGEFGFTEKEKPTMIDAHDAIVRVTLSSICTSDLHIKHGSVPRDGRNCRGSRGEGYPREAGRQSDCECRDFLRRMLLLPAWICEQLYFPTWWMGTGMQN